MVVAQLVEWSLRAPEVHGSNQFIGKEKTEIKKKRQRIADFFKKDE